MPELTENDIKAIHETHDTVIELKVLVGDGDTGLCADMKRNSQAILNLTEKHERLNGKFLLLLGILSGSGLLGGGIFGVVQALK